MSLAGGQTLSRNVLTVMGSGELEEFLSNAGVLVDPIKSDDATTDAAGNKPPQGS